MCILHDESVIEVDDALPKFIDFSAAFGGSDKIYTKEHAHFEFELIVGLQCFPDYQVAWQYAQSTSSGSL
jgi:hypothetical protein